LTGKLQGKKQKKKTLQKMGMQCYFYGYERGTGCEVSAIFRVQMMEAAAPPQPLTTPYENTNLSRLPLI
jgi:hypothetical protein